ncbi:AraC family transcriptional regulator [Aquimarina sp. RZ0]|uniref:AraC family transcriptional regulator n=1 Tax=Aquimarina sp. RZ0 TaxID=2607730 RepID=UPI0011F0AEBB|nr:AraC family transcriptional regulator [Aquimarina sp. RZ0]KAA1243471.1 AraC family transcriptional regulator [Aquimarina sp. RZ0]
MNKIRHLITPFKGENGSIFHADTCVPLVDACQRSMVEFKALARHTYPGERLAKDTEGLNTIGYWDANFEQDWGLDWHRNEGVEFHFLESGSMPYAVENSETELFAGDFTITRPWQQHKVGNPHVGIGKFYWVILDVGVRRPHQKWEWPDWIVLSKNDLERLTLSIRQNEQPVWKATPEIKDCFKKIDNLLNNKEQEPSSKLRIYINELLVLILEMFDRGKLILNESLTDSLRSAKLFLEELGNNPSHRWTIEEMANSSGLGTTRFTHHCKQLTNLTPMQVLTKKRLGMACEMLIEYPDLSASEVAYNCGFSTSQYFTTVFKKHLKTTPQKYRIQEDKQVNASL